MPDEHPMVATRWCRAVAVLFALVVFFGQPAVAQAEQPSPSRVPTFSAYSVPVDQSSRRPPVIFDKRTYEYRTRIRASAKLPVNFAGHYVLSIWGCGTNCVQGAVYDTGTGAASLLPFSICCNTDQQLNENKEMVDYRADSRLVEFNGQRNEEGSAGPHFYLFNKGIFSELPVAAMARSALPASVGSQEQPISTSAPSLPRFPKNTLYADARKSLIAIGWQPIHLTDSDKCSETDNRCKGRPEMEACAGTGMANCSFVWKRGDTMINVSTVGEDEPVVSGVSCRVGC